VLSALLPLKSAAVAQCRQGVGEATFPLQENTLFQFVESKHPTVMPRTSAITGDQIRPSKQPNKRKLQADNLEGSTSASVITTSRTDQRTTRGKQKEPPVPQRQGDEHFIARSKKRPRTGPQQHRATSVAKKVKAEVRPHTSRSQSAKLRPHSSQQSHGPVDDRRSATLSAEPPPPARLTVNAPSEPNPSHDPDFELKRCAREQFRESGDFSVFNTLLSPFWKGEKKRELSDWAYDEEKQRWRREDRSDGSIIWAPTFDSFL